MQPESKVKILLVDDRPENLLALEVVLADLGHTLVKAASGKEALRAILREDFAVILLDVRMPEMDGFETAALIRERQQSAHTPIIFLTAMGTSESEVFRGYSVGAVDYIVKPFVPRILRSKVAAFVELFKMREEVQRQAAILQEREQEAQVLAASLAAKNRDLETLLYVTSHDLREPLRGIESFARLVQERYAERLDEKGQDFLQRIMRGAERLSQLLDDVLALSRAQRMASPTGTVEAAGLVAEALRLLEAAIKETGATVQVAADLPHLVADPVWATQAIYNLVANALKFVRPGEKPEVEIAGVEAGGQVGLVVRDRGPGVAPAHAERIFQLFQRAVGREVPGTGAGLAIVRQVAERHGGRAWVQAREGGGAEFTILFGSSSLDFHGTGND